MIRPGHDQITRQVLAGRSRLRRERESPQSPARRAWTAAQAVRKPTLRGVAPTSVMGRRYHSPARWPARNWQSNRGEYTTKPFAGRPVVNQPRSVRRSRFDMVAGHRRCENRQQRQHVKCLRRPGTSTRPPPFGLLIVHDSPITLLGAFPGRRAGFRAGRPAVPRFLDIRGRFSHSRTCQARRSRSWRYT